MDGARAGQSSRCERVRAMRRMRRWHPVPEIPPDPPSTDTMIAAYYALQTASGLIGAATHADDDTRRRIASQAYDHIEEAMLRLEGEM